MTFVLTSSKSLSVSLVGLRLGLEYEYRVTGYGDLQGSLQAASEGVVFWQN